jgi:predicted alpha/beta superfamily hydrolase
MTHARTLILIGCVLTLTVGCSHTQKRQTKVEELGSATLDGTQSYALKARYINQTFTVSVALPMQPVEKGKLLPVVYVLDGDAMFGTAELASKVMQLGRDVPQMIVVGVGYYFEGLDGWDKQIKIGDARMRDLTPSRDPAFPIGGGAGPFLDYLNSEVKPFIESRYPVDTSDQTIVGHSLSALFVLQTLLHSPGSFQRYVAGSPSLWWNQSEMLKEVGSSAEKISAKAAYVSIGGLESDAEPYRSQSNFKTFATWLQGHTSPDLNLTVDVLADETHVSSQSRTIVRGLRKVFASPDSTSRR